MAKTHQELRGILRARPVKRLLGDLLGDQLSRVPKGFCADDPAADFLKYKRLILFTSLPAGIATTPRLYAEVLARFKAMKPFIDYLTKPLIAPKSKKGAPAGGHFNDSELPVNF